MKRSPERCTVRILHRSLPRQTNRSTPSLLKCHQDRYTPQNTILGITGDVKAADVVQKLEKALAVWKKTELKEVLPPNPKAAAAKRVLLVDRPGSVQTTVALGNIAIDRRDP